MKCSAGWLLNIYQSHYIVLSLQFNNIKFIIITSFINIYQNSVSFICLYRQKSKNWSSITKLNCLNKPLMNLIYNYKLIRISQELWPSTCVNNRIVLRHTLQLSTNWGERGWRSAKCESYLEPMQPPGSLSRMYNKLYMKVKWGAAHCSEVSDE